MSELSSDENKYTSYLEVNNATRDVFELQQKVFKKINSYRLKNQKEQYVPKSKFEQLQNELKQEQIEHKATQQQVKSLNERVAFVTSEKEKFYQLIQKERNEYSDNLKQNEDKLMRNALQIKLMHEKCMEAKQMLKDQHAEIEAKNEEIRLLKSKLKKKNETHQHLLNEMNLNDLQHSYFNKSKSK